MSYSTDERPDSFLSETNDHPRDKKLRSTCSLGRCSAISENLELGFDLSDNFFVLN